MSSVRQVIKRVARESLGDSSYRQVFNGYYQIRQSIRRLKPHYMWSGFRSVRRLRFLRNFYQGRRCFIIGNGPSLAAMDLSALASEITIGSNGLFLLFEKMGYLPNFYTVEDNLVAEDRATEINNISGTTKIVPRALDYCLTPDQDTIFINFLYQPVDDYPPFSDRFDKVVYHGSTVTYLNLQLAYYIGCREVYLIGVDHSYNVPSNINHNGDYGKVIMSTNHDINHFHPDYFGKGYRWHNPRTDIMEKAYISAKKFGDSHGMRIFNATRGGNLEVFPRVAYEQIVFAKNY